MSGIELITVERERQISKEGWSATHDDNEHEAGDLLDAAICYAYTDPGDDTEPVDWPWDSKWWKPSTDPVRNLVKAGALIAAEIDRLLRANPPVTEPATQPGKERESDVREQCRRIALAERVDAESTKDPGDEAYNQACCDIAEEIRRSAETGG